MSRIPEERARRLARLADEIGRGGAQLTVRTPGADPLHLGERPEAAIVTFHRPESVDFLLDGDHLSLAEAYLAGDVDIEGSWLEVMKVTEHLSLTATPMARVRLALRRVAPGRQRYDRAGIAAHYDRPAEFFLPWLGTLRCYSHGLYASEDESIDAAMDRKMQHTIDMLGLEPGMHVFDMGGGWGCFLEYAGRRGIHVHAITLSDEQYRFVDRLIREQSLPCTVERVHFRKYHPTRRFDGAVFMGTFEHNPEYAWAAKWLAKNLAPHARVWADFSAQRTDVTLGAFMKKHVWPGPITYVSPQRLVTALVREGFNIHELCDDTRSYACTVRDWGDALEANRKALAEQFGEPTVRAFLLFLRGAWRFLLDNRTQAYHLVAGSGAAPLVGERPSRATDA